VFDGTVFRLGIEDKITAIPLLLTAGYRFNTGFGAPYAGGGIGRYLFKEESEFAEAAENVDEQFTSYHALGGMEWPIGQGLAAGAEVQYLWVPDALDGALATAFDEHDLGGIQFRVRLTVGR
jgi:opacity protein-like surface antigen